MFEFFERLFSSSDFMPHGHCYLWTPGIVWLHVISDGLIAIAYYSIPFTLASFVRRRRDVDFSWMFLCFALFILACGTTHLLEIWNVWHSSYWLSGGAKALTAAASIPTAFMLVRLLPQALTLPSPAMALQVNTHLREEIAARRVAEEQLRESNARLEVRVAERTAELEATNAALHRQIAERTRTDERARWMASFPEQNPNPIAEFEAESGALSYANPVAIAKFPELPSLGLTHPWLAGLREVTEGWNGDAAPPIHREASFGETYYFITITFLPSSRRVRVYASDISERKRAEDDLKASLKEVIDLKAALDEHAIVAITDPQGRITFVNDKFCAISKYSREELIGQDHRIINSGHHPKDFFRGLWSTIGRGDVWHGEIKNRAKDGTFYWVDTTIMPFLNEHGKPQQYVAIRADITEKKRAAEALEESEEQFRTMVDAISQLAWMAHPDGHIYWYNQRWFDYTGTTLEDMEGWGWQRVHDPAVLPQVTAHWSRSIATGEPFEMDFPLRRADGTYRWFLTRAFPLKDAAGRVVRWCGTNTDVSRMRDAEREIQRLNADLEQRVIERTAQLEAANKELEAFSYSVSHDLRAPLRAVDGFSQAVLEDHGPQLPPDGQRQLRTIRESAQKMGKLIDDLLTFSRLSRAPLNKQEINTGRLVRGVLGDLAAQREGRSVDLRIGNLPPCQGDPALLKQVWINLISNALKYTKKREAAVVEIGCESSAEGQVFFVRDNGTGFDMRYAGKLFGVFQRLHRAEDYEGTGVGLALVQRIVHRHGGRVWADATLDHGATFFFTLENTNNS